jgi:hypothetical protein
MKVTTDALSTEEVATVDKDPWYSQTNIKFFTAKKAEMKSTGFIVTKNLLSLHYLFNYSLILYFYI